MQKDDVIYRQEAIAECNKRGAEHIGYAIAHLPSAQPTHNNTSNALKSLDCIDRQAAIDRAVSIPMFGRDVKMVAVSEIKNLPSAQPETAKRIVGKSRDGMTLWYQCDMCNEPVDAQDNYCRGCGRRLIDE